MRLREIRREDEAEILTIYSEYIHAQPIQGIDTFEGIRNFENLGNMRFEDWFNELEKNKKKSEIPKGYSTQTTYLVVNDDEIVGIVTARWEKVPILMLFGGLIGYSIRPKYRGKGYANEMLKLGLQKYKEKKINEIPISCKDFNIASKKVIEKNNGILQREYYNKEDGYQYLISQLKDKISKCKRKKRRGVFGRG